MAKKPKKVPLTKSKHDWAKNRDVYLVGTPVRVNQFYADKMAKVAMREVRKMHLDVSKQIKKLFKEDQAKEVIQDIAMDASLTSRARILTNKLAAEWNRRFNLFSKDFSAALFRDVESMTAKDLQNSMKKLSGGLTIDTSKITPATREIITAGTQQSSSLIKSISRDYLSDVQEAIMRSISSTGVSYTDTVKQIDSMLQGRFKVYKNKAKNVTLDQTRKAYANITDSRMRSVGVTKYRWRHAGGSSEPRHLHKNVLNGQVFSLDDPPIIDEKTGERGHPGQAINCKCYREPVLEFGNPEE